MTPTDPDLLDAVRHLAAALDAAARFLARADAAGHAPAPPVPPAPPAAAAPPPPPPARDSSHGSSHNGNPPARAFGAPASGGKLYGWCKDQQPIYDFALLRYVDDWAKLQEYPRRMTDWGPEQVKAGYAAAVARLESLPHRQEA